MTRRNATITALALTAAFTAPALATDAGAPAINSRPTPQSIAPGGNITSVVLETAAHGFPHAPTANEAADIANLALWYAGETRSRGERVSVRCYFGSTFRGAYCGVKYARGGRQVAALRWNVKVWEDGSYRFTRR